MGATPGGLHLSLYLRQQQVFLVDDPRCIFHYLCRGQSTLADKSLHECVTHTQLLCGTLLCEPTVLLLKGCDLVIVAQSSNTRCIPRFLLAGLVTETIQDTRYSLVLAYLRLVTHQ